jgi:5-methyltetrahydrofolate--homocysteine methyltransferase
MCLSYSFLERILRQLPSLVDFKLEDIMEIVLKDIYEGVIRGQAPLVQEKVKEALDSGVDPAVILNESMILAMSEVGKRFEEGEFFVPEMLIAARAMQNGMALLKPHLVASEVKSAGKVVIGTVRGDLHDIGKNLVAMMMEGAGFEIHDLGTDVSPEAFVKACLGGDVNVVAMSALLTTTMPQMEATIKALKEAGVRDKVKVIIGGAPITDDYARKIGADGFAPDASRAVRLAKALVPLV